MKYLRVMNGLKSNAGGFEYKLDEINIAEVWDTSTMEPEKMGGFNFCTEDKMLRWIHRGDTVYDVIIPDDAELVLCDEDAGIYRANKIIITNPRKLTKELIMEFYNKTTLSDKRLAQCLYILLWKKLPEVSKYIIEDRVNKKNANIYLKEFGNYVCNGNFDYDKMSDDAKELYDMISKKIK